MGLFVFKKGMTMRNQFSPDQARVAGAISWSLARSRATPQQATQPMRDAATRALNAKAPEMPEGLPPAERDARLAAFRRAHFLRLSLKSARARRQAKPASPAEPAPQETPA